MKRNLRKWEKALTGAVIAAFLIAGGFMGLEQFSPKERSLNIFDDTAAVSGTAVSDKKKSDDDTSGLKIDAKAAVLIDGSSGKVPVSYTHLLIYGADGYKRILERMAAEDEKSGDINR